VITANTVTIPADAFDLYGNETDALTAIRRVKLIRPTIDLLSVETFTVSSPPDVNGLVTAVYTGAGDGGAASGAYSRARGDGSISITGTGSDMKGVATIEFWETAGPGPGVVAGTDTLTPANWTVNAAGDTITISAATLDANGSAWFTPDSGTATRAFKLTTAAGVPVISTPIRATPFYIFASLSGTGYTAPNFQRSGTFIVTANAGENLNNTLGATLVDAAGNDILGVTPIPFGSLVITANTVTIPADAFDPYGNETDAITAIRRVKLLRLTGDLTSAALFKVWSSPVVNGLATAVYAGAGDGNAESGIWDRTSGDGSISITATGFDMKGVDHIEFWETDGPGVVGTTALLRPADWAVDAAGDTITISLLTLDANSAWYNPDSVAANRAFRLTMPDGAPVISTAIRARP
jgi:hypothetical protein